MTPDAPAQLQRWTRRSAWAVAIVCVPLLLLDWPIHKDPSFHPHFRFEGWFGFFPALSCLTCLLLMLGSKLCQIILRRPEEYYGE